MTSHYLIHNKTVSKLNELVLEIIIDEELHDFWAQTVSLPDSNQTFGTFARFRITSGLGDRFRFRFLGCRSFCSFRITVKVTILVVIIVGEALHIKVFAYKAFKTCKPKSKV